VNPALVEEFGKGFVWTKKSPHLAVQSFNGIICLVFQSKDAKPEKKNEEYVKVKLYSEFRMKSFIRPTADTINKTLGSLLVPNFRLEGLENNQKISIMNTV